ncbi:MAG: PvdJ/PvdD/PvdP-like protein [Colwellia sp.]|nr:PvdJ/PvdD/PvdP-like protein [Colwellia sp.]
MTFSRRKFLVGLSAAGVALPSIYYGQRELRHHYEELNAAGITPGEAIAEPPTDKGTWLANRLQGIWDIDFTGIGLPGLPLNGVELLLDIGTTGRSIRGYIGLPDSIRGDGTPEYSVIGDIVDEKSEKVRWRLIARDSLSAMPTHDCTALLDEVWGNWGGAGSGTLSGSIRQMDRALHLPELESQFIARKRAFPVAKDKVPLNDALLTWLISPEHRLFHQLWHASRDKWHELPDDKRDALRTLGWQPGILNKERDARGDTKHSNGSGEDFFFMHRDMLQKARLLQPDLKGWSKLPLPAPFIEQDLQGFIRYYDNDDGSSVPPAWESDGDEEYTQWLDEVKGNSTFYSNYQVWESQYQDPEYLSRLTLAEFGSEMELGMHDWLHMRWATVTRDPTNDMPVVWDRWPSDFSSRWFLPENDYLGDPFSSHISPVFWMFHRWIDDRIEDWFRAHEWFHPGEVLRQDVNDVPWFAPGRWVELDVPWLGSSEYSCSPIGKGSKTVELDIEIMKLAISIAFSGEDDVPDLMERVARRPWYARNMKLKKE